MLPKYVIIGFVVVGVINLTCGDDQISFPNSKLNQVISISNDLSKKSLSELTRRAEEFSLQLLQVGFFFLWH